MMVRRFFLLTGLRLRRLAKAVLRRWRGLLRRRPAFIADVVPAPGKGRRALMVYIVEPFLPGRPVIHAHQSHSQAWLMARALAECGFAVDVADYRSTRSLDGTPYDLIVSHNIELRIHGGGRRVYLASGTSHPNFNAVMRRAYEEVSRERGCRLRPIEQPSEAMVFLREADAVFAFANETVAATWKAVFAGMVMPFNNSFWPDLAQVELRRDWAAARRNFLFHASRDQVCKGLDLVLPVFARYPEFHLYICSNFRDEPEFCRCFFRELFQTPNIHAVGFVDILGEPFRQIAEACAFVVAPSRTEGQSGAVVNAMALGLVPILTAETGLDAGEARLFTTATAAGVEAAVLAAAAREESWVAEASRRIRAEALVCYSEAAFGIRWREMVRKVMEVEA